jgi:hypothetical protein
MAGKDGVWFASLEDIVATWVPDDDDRAAMAGEDVRGTEPAPEDSSWVRAEKGLF